MNLSLWKFVEVIDKLYPCKKCGTQVRIRSKGLCPICRSKERSPKIKSYVIKQTSKNKIKRENKSQILKNFFQYHLAEIQKTPYCENCGTSLNCNLMNIAHILPKRNTANPEVMDHYNNFMYLCSSFDGIGCHEKYDRVQGNAKVYLMSVFSKAVERYLTFRNLVKYNKYVEVFEEYIKNNDF